MVHGHEESDFAIVAVKPANKAKTVDLPVVQSTKFEFVINMQTARACKWLLGATISALMTHV